MARVRAVAAEDGLSIATPCDVPPLTTTRCPAGDGALPVADARALGDGPHVEHVRAHLVGGGVGIPEVGADAGQQLHAGMPCGEGRELRATTRARRTSARTPGAAETKRLISSTWPVPSGRCSVTASASASAASAATCATGAPKRFIDVSALDDDAGTGRLGAQCLEVGPGRDGVDDPALARSGSPACTAARKGSMTSTSRPKARERRGSSA